MKTPLDADELNLVSLAAQYSDEDKAIALLEQMRWPNGPVCPHCASVNEAYKITPKKENATTRKGLYCCGICRKQFTVRVGTIFSDSHLPTSKWLMAIFILCSSKKSISAHQMHRMLGVTYKTAWFLCHRIRFAMGNSSAEPKLKGVVEIDETFVGGTGDRKTMSLRKTPVVALIERGGKMRVRVVSSVTQKNLKSAITDWVDKSAIVNTDDSGASRDQLQLFARHDVVNHSAKEYARLNPDGTISHINTCESFFSLFKRGVHGSWHHVSREHLPKYAGEFAFRWDHRKITDGMRMLEAVKITEGKRLTYKQAI